MNDEEVLAIVARRGRRKWRIAGLVVLGLIALAVVAWFAIDGYWKHRFLAKLDGIRASGQPVTWEEVLAARPEIPDSENAGVAYLAAVAELEAVELPPLSRMLDDSSLQPPLGVRRSDRLRAIGDQRMAADARGISMIRAAANLRHASYGFDMGELPWDVWQPGTNEVRSAAWVCAGRAELHAEAGRFHEAFLDIQDIYDIGASLAAEPAIDSRLIRMGIQSSAIGALETVLALGELSPEDTAALDGRLEADEGADIVRGALIAERAYVADTMRAGEFAYPGELDLRSRIDMVLYRGMPGRRWVDGLCYLQLTDDCLSVLDLPYARQGAELERLWDQVRADWAAHGSRYLVTYTNTHAELAAIGYALEHRAWLRLARAALALENWRKAHGRWPESLQEIGDPELPEALIDPLTDGPLGFRRTDDGYRIYSFGTDGKDDGGRTEQERAEAYAEGSDIVFRLLDPEQRGARTRTFREEVLKAYDRSQLDSMGLDPDKLREMGLTDDDLRQLGFMVPVRSDE